MAIMLCPGCGKEISDRVDTCPNCDVYIGGGMAPRKQDPGDNAALRMVLPVGRSVLSIVAGYLGLFSLAIVPAPLALIVGILAVVDLKKNPKKHGMGRAVFGIVMGTLGTLALIGFILAGVIGAMKK